MLEKHPAPPRDASQSGMWQDMGVQPGNSGKLTPLYWLDQRSRAWAANRFGLLTESKMGWKTYTINAYMSKEGIDDMNRQIIKGFDLAMARVQPKSYRIIEGGFNK